jgi:hypothetical protein
VVAAEAAAERQFRTTTGPPEGWGDYQKRQNLQEAAREYVAAVVLAFARQACAAVRSGALSPDQIGWLVEDFERRASVHAYYHLRLKSLWFGWESFRNNVIPKIHDSEGWLEHLEERGRCGDAVSDTGSVALDRPQAAAAKGQRRAAVIEPLLQKRGLTRSKWADNAGVAPDVVYDYLSGQSDPRPENRNALAQVIGVPELPE